MRAMGPAYMSRRQKGSLTEPRTVREARQIFTAAKIQKLFPATDDFAGGTFNGTVEGVDGKLAQEDGSIVAGLFYRIRYEDGDGEHMKWPDLKEVLLSLPAKEDAEAIVTPAGVAKPKHAAVKAGDTSTGMVKKQKLSPAGAVLVATPTETLDAEGKPPGTIEVPHTGITKGTRSKRQRSVKTWANADDSEDNDENNAEIANTPAMQPTAVKKLRIVGPTPHASKSTVKKDYGRSTVKREFGKSSIKKEVEKFALEEKLTEDGSPGQLHKVKLVNFMCHAHFEMDFCPHINFVSGTNGSGKSAVLQAIQQVLGVRASATNRASTQKEFIRKGANEATISVTLWNKGEDAYQPEKWGSFITIDRRIGQSCSWSIKDAKGRKREENRATLDGILDGLNLNGSNPIAVMTQDVSRSFLAGSNEKADRKKFDIYMEATLMAQSQENYQIAKADLQKIADSINQAQSVYKQLKARREELSKAVEALKLMSDWQDEETQVMSGLAWATVGELEPKMHQLEQLLEHSMPGKLQKIESRLGPAQQKVAETEREYEEQLTVMAKFNESFERIRDESQSLQKKHFGVKAQARHQAQSVEAIKTLITELTKDKDELLSSMEEAQQSHDFLATQAVAQQVQEQLAQHQQSREAAIADEQIKEQAVKEAFVRLKEASNSLDDINKDVKHLEQEIQFMKQNIVNMKQSAVNRLHSFGGHDAINLGRAIRKHAGKFHQVPVGPLGYFLSLEESRWGYVVENHMQRQLFTYVVHDHHDFQLFRRLCKDTKIFTQPGQTPSVVISNFNISQHVIPAGHCLTDGVVSLVDVLKCNDEKLAHVVMNQIIDTAHPEKVALCNSPHEARLVAGQRQVWHAFVDDGSKYIQRGQTSTFIPSKAGIDYARLGPDVQAELRRAEAHLAEKQAELQQLKAHQQRAKSVHQQCNLAAKAARQESRAAASCKNQLDSQYSELLSQSQAEVPTAGIDEGEVEGNLRQLHQDLLQAQQQLMTAHADCERAQRAEEEAHTVWEAKRAEGSQLEEDNMRINSEIEAQKAAVEDAKAQLQYYQQHQHDANQKLESTKISHEDAKKLLHSNIAKAESVCSREDGEAALQSVKERVLQKGVAEDVAEQQLSTEALTQALGKLRSKMTNQEKENGGKGEDILLKHAELQSQCKEHKDRLQRLQNTYYMLKTACDKRMSDLQRIDRALEESVNTRFNFYMYKKGHTGMIKVKRATEEHPGTLEIKVRIGGNEAKTGNVKDLKQLSGGEKSYTTVAFALALGEWTQSPFRAMDEFDVFMDAVNRRVAMENLFGNSLEHPDLQFIFLTPQDINAVEEAKKNLAARGTPLPEGYCKVVQMRPARE